MKHAGLTLSKIEGEYSVCRLEPNADIPSWATAGSFFTISRTSDELSIVCDSKFVPEAVKAEHRWKCLKVAGPLDFSLTGILAALVAPLGESGISIFAPSTFDTDYLLVRKDNLKKAILVLENNGHTIIE